MHYHHPDQFKIQKSTIPNANLGLFFKGTCKAGDDLCGYGGKLRSATVEDPGHYSVILPGTGMLIDSACYHNRINKYVHTFRT